MTGHAIYVGPSNCEMLMGIPWRRAKEIAIRHGITRIRAGKTLLLPLAELRAALERPPPSSPADAERQVMESLAENRRASGT